MKEVTKTLDAKVEMGAQLTAGVNYKGVIYCDILDDQFLKGSVTFDGDKYRIVLGYNYQRHCKLWVE